MDLAALKTELLAGHPATGPYSADDEMAANQINAPNRTPNREMTDAGTLIASIVRAEYDSLQAAPKAYLNAVLSVAGSIPLTTTFKQNLGAIFAAGTQTRANFLALQNRTGSRAEELGFGVVNPSHVADARRLP
jgi:hypothetical protein